VGAKVILYSESTRVENQIYSPGPLFFKPVIHSLYTPGVMVRIIPIIKKSPYYQAIFDFVSVYDDKN